jgi:hypothetical protein
MNMIRNGLIEGVGKCAVRAQVELVSQFFGVGA